RDDGIWDVELSVMQVDVGAADLGVEGAKQGRTWFEIWRGELLDPKGLVRAGRDHSIVANGQGMDGGGFWQAAGGRGAGGGVLAGARCLAPGIESMIASGRSMLLSRPSDPVQPSRLVFRSFSDFARFVPHTQDLSCNDSVSRWRRCCSRHRCPPNPSTRASS